MSWVDGLIFGVRTLIFGNAQSQRPAVVFAGTGISVTDDSANNQTIVTITAGSSAGQQTNTLSNGLNSNIATNGLPTLRLGGPSGAFSVGGWAPLGGQTLQSGQTLTVVNTTSQPMTIVHEDTSSTATNRIDTQSGLPVVLSPGRKTSATFVYDGTSTRWVLKDIGFQQPPLLNARDYGATGNGVTDDTTALNNFFAAMRDTHARGVRGVIPAGDYIVSAQLTFSDMDGAVLEGYGGQARLIWNGTNYTGSATAVPLLLVQSCYRCKLRDFQITTAGASNRLAIGIQVTTHAGTVHYSTHNHFEGIALFGPLNDEIEQCVVLGGDSNSNNDFHTFVSCRFNNYAKDGVEIRDTQVYQPMFVNCLTGETVWRTSATGNMSSSSTTLQHGGVFSQVDVGKWIEVAGAGAAGAVLRTFIQSYTDATHVVLATAASTTVTNATITYGSQCGVRCTNGSFTWHGGSMASHLYCDVYATDSSSGEVRVDGGCIFEGSRQLLDTAGSATATKKVGFYGIRFSGENAQSYWPTIRINMPGQVVFDNCTIGDPGANYPIWVQWSFGASLHNEFSQVVFRNCQFASTFTSSSIWGGYFPAKVDNCRINNVSGCTLMGQQPYNGGAAVTGSFSLDFGIATDVAITMTGATTITPSKIYVGRGTRMRLYITHSGASGWAYTWDASIHWPGGSAPASGTQNKTDVFDFNSDGTTIYASVVGAAYA